MCGIVGYIGKKNCLPILIHGLKKLEYRGYDSAGIAYFNQKEINIVKSVGKINKLENKIPKDKSSHIGIGHTRWATHGEVTETNAHPHQCNKITIVHNGILENYIEIKNQLTKKGYKFKSNTDSEVLAGYIDYWYSQNKDMISTLEKCTKDFIGSYAVVIMNKDIPNKLFLLKNHSPMVIGIGENEYYIASDSLAYLNETKHFVILEDGNIGEVTPDNFHLFQNGLNAPYKIQELEDNNGNGDLGNYPSYMMKEMMEQPTMIRHLNDKYLNHLEKLPNITSYSKIIITACGSAYHAGMVGKYLLEEYANIEVSVKIASEYRYSKMFIDKKTLVIAISQSGETADTLACIKKAKELGAVTLGIVNVKNSSIARLVDEVIYTEAGVEVAVATTKAYLAQIYILSLLTYKCCNKKINSNKIIDSYLKLPTLIEKALNKDYKPLIEKIYSKNNVFFLGRNIDYATMLEGSLKLKEISYIHAECYAAGELKHGTISLIEDGTIVLGLVTKDDIYHKTISNLMEVKSRGAYVILITKKENLENIGNHFYDEAITLENLENLTQMILNVIPLQMISYQVALKKGLDIDKPRNLAKSVTVE